MAALLPRHSVFNFGVIGDDEFHKLDCSAVPQHNVRAVIGGCNVLGDNVAISGKIYYDVTVLGQAGSKEGVD